MPNSLKFIRFKKGCFWEKAYEKSEQRLCFRFTDQSSRKVTDMPVKKTASIILLLVGIGLLVASLLADAIGIGDDPGFGRQQTMGTIAGAIVTAVGLFLTLKKSKVWTNIFPAVVLGALLTPLFLICAGFTWRTWEASTQTIATLPLVRIARSRFLSPRTPWRLCRRSPVPHCFQGSFLRVISFQHWAHMPPSIPAS